jgi:hypothetical protein
MHSGTRYLSPIVIKEQNICTERIMSFSENGCADLNLFTSNSLDWKKLPTKEDRRCDLCDGESINHGYGS